MTNRHSASEMGRRNLDKRLAKAFIPDPPPKGWIRAIRDALGMTTTQMAERMGVAQSRIVALEKEETAQSLTLKTLDRAARALGCRMTYVLVPDDTLEAAVKQRARQKAEAILKQAGHTMGLEGQPVSAAEKRAQLEELVEELLQGTPARLWDEWS